MTKNQVVAQLRAYLRDPNHWVTPNDSPEVHKHALSSVWTYALQLTRYDVAQALDAMTEAVKSGRQADETSDQYHDRLMGIPSLAFGTADPYAGVDKPQHFFRVADLVYASGGFKPFGESLGRLYEVKDAVVKGVFGKDTGGYDVGDIHADDLGAEFGNQLTVTPTVPLGLFTRPPGESLPDALDRLGHEAAAVGSSGLAGHSGVDTGNEHGEEAFAPAATRATLIAYNWPPAGAPKKSTDGDTHDGSPGADDSAAPDDSDSGDNGLGDDALDDDSGDSASSPDDSGDTGSEADEVYEFQPEDAPWHTETGTDETVITPGEDTEGGYWPGDWGDPPGPHEPLDVPAILGALRARIWDPAPDQPEGSSGANHITVVPGYGYTDPPRDEAGTHGTPPARPLNYIDPLPDVVTDAWNNGASLIIVHPPRWNPGGTGPRSAIGGLEPENDGRGSMYDPARGDGPWD